MLVQTIKLFLRLFACYPSLLGLAYDVQFDPISIQTKWCLHVCPSDHDQIGFRPFLCSWPSAKRFMWIFYALWYYSQQYLVNDLHHKSFFRHWEYQRQHCCQSIFSYDCLPAITLCLGWPVMCDMTTMLEKAIPKLWWFVLFCGIALHLSPLVTVQTVTWQVKNFGAETTTALSRQKPGWNGNGNLEKFGKKLTKLNFYFNITLSGNGKIWDTIMYRFISGQENWLIGQNLS